MKVASVLETCLYVHDIDAAERFYCQILGLDTYAKVPGRHVFFRCGEAMLLLFQPDATETTGTRGTSSIITPNGIPAHGARGAGHVAFGVPREDFEAWREHLLGHGVALESDFTWPNGGRSLYFRDPSGNSLELVTPDTWNLRR
jgi:catechol 2,3-dioxygenase-like lactoylglutathione lyase family enzyme